MARPTGTRQTASRARTRSISTRSAARRPTATAQKLAELIERPRGVRLCCQPDAPHARDDGAACARSMGLPRDGYRTDRRLIEVHFGDWTGFTPGRTESQQDPEFQRRRRTRQMEHRAARQRRRKLPDASGCACGPGSRNWRSRPSASTPWRRVCAPLSAWSEGLSDDEAANMGVPQDRVLNKEGALGWLYACRQSASGLATC